MRTIAIANQAGSAGKTTTAVTLAALLAREGRTVRLIDLDAQANASAWLGATAPQANSGGVLLGHYDLAAATTETEIDRLTLLPATHELDEQSVEIARTLGGEQRLRRALENAPHADVTIIDCPGAMSVLVVAALVAADVALTVTRPSVKEIAGIPQILSTISDVAAAYNPKLELGGIVPCEVPPPSAGSLYTEAMELLQETYPDLTTPSVRRSVRVAESYSQQQPLSEWAPTEAVTDDYRAVTAWLHAQGVIA